MKELWVKNKINEIKHICVDNNFDLSDYEIIEEPKADNAPEYIIEEVSKREKVEKVEVKEITEEELNQREINALKSYLSMTDWVVIKTLELQMKGEKVTHDYSDILAEREKARAKINELEAITAVGGANKNFV